MPSFHAELHLTGNRYRVVRCHQACHQGTDARGRVSTKVRHDLLHLTLDVPDDDTLLAWAATPHKPLAGEVVFYSATQLVALETIAFTAGECVGYHEVFENGASGDGSYVCQLTITAPAFELRAGGAPAAMASSAVDKAMVVAKSIVGPAMAPTLSSVKSLSPPSSPSIEYSFDEFKETIWGADQVPLAVIEQLYAHFNAAKASSNPAPHWAEMENVVRSTTYPNKKPGLPDETLNGGWPPASGGFNKRIVQPAPPDTFDRYQKEAKVDPVTGAPILSGKFTSPIPPGGAFDYEARALEGKEDEYDLMYEVKILKPLPFKGEEADIIPWHGHTGNGVQTKMLFPPFDPTINDYPWDWKKLEQEGYVKITYKSSPNGKFSISPDGTRAIIK